MKSKAPQKLEYNTKRCLEDVGIEVDRVMRSRKATINQLAPRIGITPEYLAAILRGDVDFDLKLLVDIGLQLEHRWDFQIVQKTPAQATL